jgi:hypothetical protein
MARPFRFNRVTGKTAASLIVCVVAVLSFGGCGGGNYKCSDNHCYGLTVLPAAQNGEPGFRGFVTTVNAVALNSGDGEINDEIWVVDKNSAGCGGQCWIEVGLSAGANTGGCSLPSNETHVFWADNRPNQGFFCHDQGALQAQEFNQPVFLAIAVRPTDPNSFDVEALTCTSTTGNGTCQRRAIIGTSTNNTMAATAIEMGMELAGTNGASAPATNFTGSLTPNPNVSFGWTFLKLDGNILQNAPVKGAWTTTPSTSNSGGSFQTSCCQ